PKFSLADMISGAPSGMPIERFFIALTHLGMPAAGMTEPDIGLVIGVEMREAKDLGLVKALWSMIPTAEQTVTHGTRSYVMKSHGDGPPISLAFLDRLAVVSLSPKTIETVMDNATAGGTSLADTPEYKQMLGLTGQKLQADSSTWMLRTGLLADMLRDIMAMVRQAMAGSTDAEDVAKLDATAKIIDSVGLRSIQW